MIQHLLERTAANYGSLTGPKAFEQYGGEILEKILAKYIDSDKNSQISLLMNQLHEEKKINKRYKEALELIRDHHPRCSCMDSGGIAKEALEPKFGDRT